MSLNAYNFCILYDRNFWNGLYMALSSMKICRPRIVYQLKMKEVEKQQMLFTVLIDLAVRKDIWAATYDFQQCGILTSVDSDEPVNLLLSIETPNDVWSVA